MMSPLTLKLLLLDPKPNSDPELENKLIARFCYLTSTKFVHSWVSQTKSNKSKQRLTQKNKVFKALRVFNRSWPFLTCPVLTFPDLSFPFLSCPYLPITTSSREISVVEFRWFIFPYHEIGILTRRPGGEGGKAMSSREDYLV